MTTTAHTELFCSCKASQRDGQHMAWCPAIGGEGVRESEVRSGDELEPKRSPRYATRTADDNLLSRLDDQGLFSKADRIQMIKDAAAEIRRLRGAAQAPIDPTNHHNALKCPYCNPNDAVRKAVIEECARKVVQISVLADQFRCAFGLGLAESIRGLSVPSADREGT